MDIKAWMKDAANKINSLDDGTEFVLRDLFDVEKWEKLSPVDRRNFGKYFKNDVLEGCVTNTVYIDKPTNGSAKYRKVKD